ncbi:MAG: hypothetical protein Q8T09_08205 [Candidatus Melainabacteria bacterium]|nr:hypothetical protein [Candidatus Melainabacteria bacterium]
MKTIISLNNGRSKVLHGRFGGYEKGRNLHDEYPTRTQMCEKQLDQLAELEVAACKDNLPMLHAESLHPHDLGLPDLSLVRARLAEGDFRCGITEVLHGALGVSQFRTNRIHFAVPGHHRNSRGKRLVLQLELDESGAIIAAHYG